MKPLLLLLALAVFQSSFAQSLDYISVRKKNGRVLKNFYAGSNILLQTTDGSYLEGPVNAVRNDSLFVMLYDIRRFPTIWGTYTIDTIASTVGGIRAEEIKRIYIHKRKGFLQSRVPPLLMMGGAGYMALNLLNGSLYSQSITDKKNVRRLGTAAGAFGLGFLLGKLFSSDGFNKRSAKIVYVDLKPPKPL